MLFKETSTDVAVEAEHEIVIDVLTSLTNINYNVNNGTQCKPSDNATRNMQGINDSHLKVKLQKNI